MSYSDAFDLQFAVVIFRLRAGFDATEKMEETGWYVVIVLWYNSAGQIVCYTSCVRPSNCYLDLSQDMLSTCWVCLMGMYTFLQSTLSLHVKSYH